MIGRSGCGVEEQRVVGVDYLGAHAVALLVAETPFQISDDARIVAKFTILAVLIRFLLGSVQTSRLLAFDHQISAPDNLL